MPSPRDQLSRIGRSYAAWAGSYRRTRWTSVPAIVGAGLYADAPSLCLLPPPATDRNDMAYESEDLQPGATACVNTFGQVSDDDSVLIVSDSATIANALVSAVRARSKLAEVHTVYLSRAERPLPRLGLRLAEDLGQVSIAFVVLSDYDIFHDYYEQEHSFRQAIVLGQRRGKLFFMPGATEATFLRQGALGLNPDEFAAMAAETHGLAVALTLARTATITTTWGTELEMRLDGPENVGFTSTGEVEPGKWGNLPPGEAFVLPATASGKLCIDLAIAGMAPGFDPITVDVIDSNIILPNKRNKLFELVRMNEEKARLEGTPEQNVRRVCEFGIGTNRYARAISLLEIEKIRGTVHVAIGTNTPFGGDVKAPNHTDMVIGRPTVTLDDYTVIDQGRIETETIRQFIQSPPGSWNIDQDPERDIVERRNDGVREQDEMLQIRWTNARGHIDATVGSEVVARWAANVWTAFDGRDTREVKQLKRDAKLLADQVTTALRAMEAYGAVRIRKQHSVEAPSA